MESMNRPDNIVIPEQFRGPPMSGNGGYVCGVFAGQLLRRQNNLDENQAIEVTLRAPTPLDKPLQVVHEDDQLRVMDAETLVADAVPATLELEIPEPPSWDEALAAQSNSLSFQPRLNPIIPEGTGFHPICFCCGADVPEGEGLRVFCAPVQNNEQVAAAWQPHESFGDENGYLLPEHMWTALDCPGQFAYMAGNVRTGMLGRLTARIEKPIKVEERCLVTGWRIETIGRRHFAGTALFNAAGECCAYAKAIWVAFKPK
ncbi:MAG: hypothetical protein AAF512_18260 [Pseudomonadota bacterium]